MSRHTVICDGQVRPSARPSGAPLDFWEQGLGRARALRTGLWLIARPFKLEHSAGTGIRICRRIMNRASFAILLLSTSAISQTTVATMEGSPGEALFKAGEFEKAELTWRSVSPQTADSLAWRALLAEYANRLDEADGLARQSQAIDSKNARAGRVLTEDARRRRDLREDYTHSFRGTVEVPFVKREPLPVLAARLPDGKDHYFILDTGGGALRLNADVARFVTTPIPGDETGTYAGGKAATVQHAMLASIEMGSAGDGFVLRHIPVDVAPMSGMAHLAGPDVTIDGVIGTHLLVHFLSTIDYLHAKLVLAPSDSKHQTETRGTSILLVSDHLVFARGVVSDDTRSEQGWLLVDTGLAGGGFMPGPGLRSAMTLPAIGHGEGVGGGGQVKTEEFKVPQLQLGDFRVRDVMGVETLGGSALNAMPFHTTGLISHGAFGGHTLTFDFSRMMLWVD